MPLYHYRGYKPDGKKVRGSLQADGEGEAVLKLRDEGIYPSEITRHTSAGKPSRFSFSPPGKNLPHFTRQLAILLSAGVPLSDALRSIASEYSGFWQGLVSALSERVLEGASLSRAIGEYPGVFPEYYAGMVAASEMGGNLHEVLETLADFLETDNSIKKKVQTAMLYPAFMVVVSVFVLSFVFTFVVPKILRIFEQSDTPLPFITVILIKISYVFQNYWWLMGIISIGLVMLLRNLHRRYPRYLHTVTLRIPALRALYYSRLTGTLGFLLKGGLPILRALELSADVSGNSRLRSVVLNVSKSVSEGGTIASSLQGVSPVLRQIVSTGEKSGNLPDILIQASESYKKDFIRWAEQITALLEPILILAMGIIVGFIVFGVLLPIFQINQIVR